MSRPILAALRLMYSMVFSWVRRLSVPTNTFGRGSINQRLSIPRMASGVSLATMTVMQSVPPSFWEFSAAVFLFDALLEQGAYQVAPVVGVLAHGLKRRRKGSNVLIEVSHIVDEGQRAAVVDESQRRQVTERANDGSAQCVEAGVGSGQRAIDVVGEIPVGFVVVASFPSDAVPLAELGVPGAHAQTLHAAQFGDGIRLHIHAGEPLDEHAAGDLGVFFLFGPSGGVFAGHQVVVVWWDAKRVEPHPVLADPADGRIGIRAGFHCRVRHRGARPE